MKINFYIFLLFLPCFLTAQDLYFPPNSGDEWETFSLNELNWCEDKTDELFDLLETGDTKAFIVLKDGKIVIEKYFNGFEADDTHQWASAGKTITSLLVGIAQEENLLNIGDKTSDYLGTGWTTLTPDKENLITLRHQLTMTSGMDDSDSFCTDRDCLTYLTDAGTRWAYHNAPYTLLSEVIEAATGKTPNNYAFSKLLLPTGMGGLFIKIGYNKVFFSKPRSMARFGLLILNKGKWKNTTILGDQNYFEQMTIPSQNINTGYGYLWWLNDTDSFMLPQSQVVFPGNPTPTAPKDMYSGIGKDGQFLDIVPSQNLVVIRMGSAPSGDLVPLNFHNDMWGLLSEIICSTSDVDAPLSENDFEVFPNPFSESIHFKNPVESVQIFNAVGQLVLSDKNARKIKVDFLPKGVYHLLIEQNIGSFKTMRVVKN